MKHILTLLAGLLMLAAGTIVAHAANVTFGSGSNQFAIEFVEIGNAGNAADTTGSPNPVGAVSYAYSIGKYEISRDMITKANAQGGLGITLADLTAFGGNGINRPATGITWFEAATFVNWLNTSSGGTAAYKFDMVGGTFSLWESGDAGFDASNPYRNSLATYWLPSVDEWYKAAYYDPNTASYFDYPTGNNTAPTAVASGTLAGTAVYIQAGPADITQAGGLSPYGTMGQGGNAAELEETAFDLGNDTTGEGRGFRGGSWGNVSLVLRSLNRSSASPSSAGNGLGFRVATVPEPSRALLSLLGLGAMLMRRRR